MKQESLNEEMLMSGRKKFWNSILKSRESSLEGRVGYGQEILRHVMPPYLKAFDEFKDSLESFRAPSQLNYYRVIHCLPSPVICYLASKVIVDCISKSFSLNKTCLKIGMRIEDEIRWVQVKKENPELWKGVQSYNKKYSNSYDYVRQGFRSALKKAGMEWRLFRTTERASAGYVMLEMFRRSTGLIKYIYLYEEGLKGSKGVSRKRMYVTPTEKTLEWIKNFNSSKEFFKPDFLPSVKKPKDWLGLFEGGYDLDNLSLVKDRYRGNSKSLEKVMSSTNLAQSTKWKINEKVLRIAKYCWEKGISMGCLVDSQPEPLPPEPDFKDEEAKKNWRKQCGAIYKRNHLSKANRILIAKTLSVADKFIDQDFYFPCQLDFRSRLYYLPTPLNPQGTDLAKSLLQFSEGHKLDTDEAVRWFFIHGANLMGQDKKTYEERINHIKENHEEIIKLAEDPIRYMALWQEKAEDVWRFLAWAVEYSSLCKNPECFVSHLPIHVDATNNGLQILSLLSGDVEGAEATNVIESGDKVRDIYLETAERVQERLRSETDDRYVQYADKWLQIGISRTLMKKPVMVVPYSGTFHAFSKSFMDFLNSQSVEHFQDKVKACNYLSKIFVEVIGRVILKPVALMDWFKSIADQFTSSGIAMDWQTPSGFLVTQDYKSQKQMMVQSRVGEKLKFIRFSEDQPEKDSRKMRNAVSANIVHSLDASILHLAVNACARAGVKDFSLVHDSFGVHAKYVQVLQDALKNEIISIFSLDLLKQWVHKWEYKLGKELGEFEKGQLKIDHLSEYFFC